MVENKGSSVVKFWSDFIDHHFWFCNHSRNYIGNNRKYKNKDIRYFPIAWVKFMYYSLF